MVIRILLTIVFTVYFMAPISAKEVIFTVGGDQQKGMALAKKGGGIWFKTIKKALVSASLKLAGSDENYVIIKIASGIYHTPIKGGGYKIPTVKNPNATLHIQGGYAGDFSRRSPFLHPTRLVPPRYRGRGFFDFPRSRPRSGQNELKAFILDGILMDNTRANVYNGLTKNLSKGRSSSAKALTFSYFKTNHLEIRNSIFLNFPHRVLSFLIRPASPQCIIRLYNNIFLNCVIPLKMDASFYRIKTAKMIVEHCSFLMSWPYNVDPFTSNPATVEIGGRRIAQEVIFRRNLFYANLGGALFILYRSWPKITIEENNFVGNGFLYGDLDTKSVALIIHNKRGLKQRLSLDEMAKFSGVTCSKNVSIVPGIPLSFQIGKKVTKAEVLKEEDWDEAMIRLLGEDLKITHTAPAQKYNQKNPPFPLKKKAKGYGASPDLVDQSPKK